MILKSLKHYLTEIPTEGVYCHLAEWLVEGLTRTHPTLFITYSRPICHFCTHFCMDITHVLVMLLAIMFKDQ